MTRDKLTSKLNLFQAPFSVKCGVSHVRVFTYIDKTHFLILENFQNAYLVGSMEAPSKA